MSSVDTGYDSVYPVPAFGAGNTWQTPNAADSLSLRLTQLLNAGADCQPYLHGIPAQAYGASIPTSYTAPAQPPPQAKLDQIFEGLISQDLNSQLIKHEDFSTTGLSQPLTANGAGSGAAVDESETDQRCVSVKPTVLGRQATGVLPLLYGRCLIAAAGFLALGTLVQSQIFACTEETDLYLRIGGKRCISVNDSYAVATSFLFLGMWHTHVSSLPHPLSALCKVITALLFSCVYIGIHIVMTDNALFSMGITFALAVGPILQGQIGVTLPYVAVMDCTLHVLGTRCFETPEAQLFAVFINIFSHMTAYSIRHAHFEQITVHIDNAKLIDTSYSQSHPAVSDKNG